MNPNAPGILLTGRSPAHETPISQLRSGRPHDRPQKFAPTIRGGRASNDPEAIHSTQDTYRARFRHLAWDLQRPLPEKGPIGCTRETTAARDVTASQQSEQRVFPQERQEQQNHRMLLQSAALTDGSTDDDRPRRMQQRHLEEEKKKKERGSLLVQAQALMSERNLHFCRQAQIPRFSTSPESSSSMAKTEPPAHLWKEDMNLESFSSPCPRTK